MNFHDTRENYDRIAKWLEENDNEINWEELMKSPWWVAPPDWVPPPKWSMPSFPKRITPQMVTNMLLSRENGGLEIPLWVTEGGEGVEPAAGGAAATGSTPWEKFLETLASIQLRKFTITLVSAEERRQLVKMAWIEEELRRRETETNRERVKRQIRGQASEHMTRWGVKRLVRSASHGKEEAIAELERRDVVTRGQIERWRETRGKLVKRCKEMVKMKKMKDGEQIEVAVKDNKPRETELEIMRVGPNPRVLTCMNDGKIWRVRVKSIAKFKVGMKIVMEVPAVVDGAVLEYTGKLPRYTGRW